MRVGQRVFDFSIKTIVAGGLEESPSTVKLTMHGRA